MSENENGGILGGLLMGFGVAAIVLTPFYIAYRFGVHVLAVIVAVLTTFYALISPWLASMASQTSGAGGSSFFELASRLILQFDAVGWWKIAALAWLMAGLMVLSVVARSSRTAGGDAPR